MQTTDQWHHIYHDHHRKINGKDDTQGEEKQTTKGRSRFDFPEQIFTPSDRGGKGQRFPCRELSSKLKEFQSRNSFKLAKEGGPHNYKYFYLQTMKKFNPLFF